MEIHELNYHPLESDELANEFIELYNAGTSPVDLGGWSFSDGIQLQFPAGTWIGPREHLVLSPDPTAFRQRHPGVSRVVGPYGGRLDNDGEIVILVDGRGREISRVHYKDSGAWPSSPDGKGPSLERLRPGWEGDRPEVWAPSRILGGTPGEANSRRPEEYPYPGDDPRPLLRINEVGPAVSLGDTGFLELFNAGSTSAAAQGLRLVSSLGHTATIPAGFNIASGSRVVVPAAQLSLTIPAAAATWVLLEADGKTILDHFEASAPPAGFSSGRFPDGREDGHVAPATPGAPNVFEPNTSVIIHEVFFSPRFEAPSGDCLSDCSDRHQWIELHNRGAQPVSLAGWSLTRGVEYDFPRGSSLAAGGYLVVAASRATFETEHPTVTPAPGEWRKSLGGREDTIRLRDNLGNIVDSLHYGNGRPYNDESPEDGRDDGTVTSSDWPTDVSGSGRSIELANADLENEYGLAWRLGPVGGTPGQGNSAHENDPLPIVARVRHTPPVPTSAEDILVTCRAHGAGAVESVELRWRLDGDAGFTPVAMKDDGSDADAVAGDSIYSGFMPRHASRSVLAYQIAVTSATGKAAVYPLRPRTGSRTPYYLCEVDDDAPLDNGSVDYRVIMTRSDAETLRGRPTSSDVLLNATFISGDDVRHMTTIRYRGENSRNLSKKAYQIRFPPEDRFRGIEVLNLQAPNRVGSSNVTALYDFISADLFRRMGLPCPMEWPVNLYFQEGVQGDLTGRSNVDRQYVYKEHVARDFLDRYFGKSNGGNLYRARDPQTGRTANLSYYGTDPSVYAPLYEKRSNEDLNDFTDVIELTRAFDTNQTPDEQFEQEMRRLLDVEQWAAFFAIEDYLTNIDGGIWTNNGEDYLLYHVPADAPLPTAGKWLIIPWDLEEVFDNPGAGMFLVRVDAPRRFLLHRAFAPLYLKAMQRLADGPGSSRDMSRSYSYVPQVYPSATATSVLGSLDAYVTERVRLIRAQLPQGLEVSASSPGAAGGDKLIQAGDIWTYFKGTVEPSGGGLAWAGIDFNDRNWSSGASGFGYGDGDDATTLNDMQRRRQNPGYLTLYVRKTFQVADPAALTSLSLVIDYDDAFVAYLNGAEVARSAGLDGVGSVGQAIPHDTELGDTINHEATAGGGGPIETHPMGSFRDILVPGKNVLAIQGFNSTSDSSDFSLIPELVATEGVPSDGGGWGSAIFVSGPIAKLCGYASAAGVESVRVAGVEASINGWPPGSGPPYRLNWSASVNVAPGEQLVKIEAFSGPGASGELVAARVVTVHRIDKAFRSISGDLAGSTTWTPAEGPYFITSSVTVPAGSSLVIQPGTQVLLAGDATLVVNGRLEARGTEEAPVELHPYSLGLPWRGILLADTGTDAGSPLHLLEHVHAELGRAPSGGAGVILARGSRLVVTSSSFESSADAWIQARNGELRVEDCRFEDARGGVSGTDSNVSVLRSTFRRLREGGVGIGLTGNRGPTNELADNLFEACGGNGIGIFNGTASILRNELRGLQGSGLFLSGEPSSGLTWSEGNTLFDCATGITHTAGMSVGDGAHNTIVACGVGISLVGSQQNQTFPDVGYHSMILWANLREALVTEPAALDLTWSDVEGDEPWPGQGNILADPRFVDLSSGDLRLAAGSPCRGTGRTGADMGATGAAPPQAAAFIRGDFNGDEKVNLTDGVGILQYLFQGGASPRCADSADTNDSGAVNLSDAVYLLNHLFQGGPTIAPPYPEAGVDGTDDVLPPCS